VGEGGFRSIPKPSDFGKAGIADSGLAASCTWSGLFWWDFGKLRRLSEGADNGSHPDHMGVLRGPQTSTYSPSQNGIDGN
jgi:hypothetical protein